MNFLKKNYDFKQKIKIQSRNSIKLLLILTVFTLLFNCEKEESFEATTQNEQAIEQPNGVPTILGKKLENPYSVENMKNAYQNLQQKSKSGFSKSGNNKIKTTHLYIKFMPKTEDELSILKRDSTLTLYEYPLDYEITERGDYYRDPSVPNNQPTYQYCAVKVGKTLPNGVEHERLEELFIPDEDKDDVKGKSSYSYNIDALVDEALKITNNLEPEDINIKFRRRKWRPAGAIRVWDDVLDDYIGVEGVKVRARRWFTTHTGIANINGIYSCDGRFRRDANYSIDWERYHFALQDGWLNSANYNGPKQKGNWNLNLNSGVQQYYATIFIAAHLYYYGDRLGLTSPPRNAFFKRQLRIRARLKRDKSSYIKARRIYFGSDISLQAWGNSTDRVFGTTIHELAHAAHREVDGSAYNSLVWKAYTSPCAPSAESCDHPGPTGADARRLMETWATTVENFIVRERYVNFYNVQNYTYIDNFLQSLTISEENFYTSCGIDMIDGFNQREEHNNNLLPIDRVEGYTINQLESALKSATSWTEWRVNLRSNETNNTAVFLNELFSNWTN